jgi:hypothetical protein
VLDVGRATRVVAVGACGVALALGAIAFPVAAAEVTRDSYREAVEPICKAHTEANDRILRGVREKVKHDRLKPAAKQLSRAARALRGIIPELKAVPQPPADQRRLAKWLGFFTSEAMFFERAAAQLQRGNKPGAQETVIRLTHNANQANNVSAPFEFDYCRVDTSRFT